MNTKVAYNPKKGTYTVTLVFSEQEAGVYQELVMVNDVTCSNLVYRRYDETDPYSVYWCTTFDKVVSAVLKSWAEEASYNNLIRGAERCIPAKCRSKASRIHAMCAIIDTLETARQQGWLEGVSVAAVVADELKRALGVPMVDTAEILVGHLEAGTDEADECPF